MDFPTSTVICKVFLDKDAKLPVRGTPGSAGYDLCANQYEVIAPGARRLIKTGVYLRVPDGHYGRIAPRSGLALKHGIDVLAGVIDSDYRGEIGVILVNTDREQLFQVSMGDRIAQLIFEKCSTPALQSASSISDLDSVENDQPRVYRTERFIMDHRYEGGFGHTGC